MPAAYLFPHRFASQRAGLATAAMVAVNLLLVHYSQEARAYSLLVLLSTVGLVLRPSARATRRSRARAGCSRCFARY